MIRAEFRPIAQWPGRLHASQDRKASPFTATHASTLDLLASELDHLAAHDVVIELAMQASEIRVDGWPRATARPVHPGVIVSFGSKHGPLRYFTDEFRGHAHAVGWQANLRAIALGLESLRKLDRYGITSRGEQYQGWSALPPGGPEMPVDVDDAIMVLHDLDPHAEWDYDDPRAVRDLYRHLSKIHHPDRGGDPYQFQRLERARDILLNGSTA